mgnify:CR=1 FL=1|tara:strand:- start:573 stop:968 length:396 start_codon:yes stop_codon:yes gene_type:complete
MSYIIITASADKTSKERCDEIAEALWTIQRPRSVRSSSDVTTKYCGVITHSDGRAALCIASDDQIRPHEDLVTTELFDSMSEYTTQKKTAVTTKLGDNHGVKIDVGDILPASLTYTTHAAMDADGWFPDPA